MHDKYKALLQSIDLYKVGHHGSWNATPKKLWKLFKKKSSSSGPARLKTLMSTLEEVFHEEHEVPRGKLVTNRTCFRLSKYPLASFSKTHWCRSEVDESGLGPLNR